LSADECAEDVDAPVLTARPEALGLLPQLGTHWFHSASSAAAFVRDAFTAVDPSGSAVTTEVSNAQGSCFESLVPFRAVDACGQTLSTHIPVKVDSKAPYLDVRVGKRALKWKKLKKSRLVDVGLDINVFDVSCAD
jgi:hypothetical protein